MKWISFDDEGFMKQRVTHIEGLRSATNVHHHGVQIFSETKPVHRWSDTKRVQHTLVINMDAFGEHVEKRTFPFGTHIREVKENAESRLETLRAEGHQIVSG